MKKLISAFIALVMLNCLFSIAIADGKKSNAITSGDYQYELLSDGGVSILKYKGGSEQITIPDPESVQRVQKTSYPIGIEWNTDELIINTKNGIKTFTFVADSSEDELPALENDD